MKASLFNLMLVLWLATLTTTQAYDDLNQGEDESDEDYIKRINGVYWPEQEAPDEENGLIYTVAQSMH